MSCRHMQFRIGIRVQRGTWNKCQSTKPVKAGEVITLCLFHTTFAPPRAGYYERGYRSQELILGLVCVLH